MKRLKKDFKVLLRGYKIIFSIDKTLIPLNIIRSMLDAVMPFILVYGSAEIINALSRKDEAKKIIMILAITVVASTAAHIANEVVWRTINVKEKYFERQFAMYLNNKILGMDYSDIENPETHIKRQRIDEIRRVGGGGIWKLVYQSRDMVSSLFTIILSVAMTYKAFVVYSTISQNGFVNIIASPPSSVVLVIFILLNTLITIYFNGVGTVKTHETWNEAIPHNRMLVYIFTSYINSYHAGKDIRLYDQKQMVMNNFKKALKNFERIFSKMERNQVKYSSINTASSAVIGLLVYIFVGVRAVCGLIGLGDLFKYINSINKFSAGLNGFLNSFNSLRTNNAYLEVLYDYLDIPNKKYQGTISVEKRDDNEYEIEFKNVSFKYPGSENYALKNVSLKLNIGQKLAVVGQNGSGKTTMIKLLCRLYDPTEGIITLNGIDIKKYDYDEY
ncbi:MAG: ABC transporter ATP-binding protein/permease, partial [Oscillospiraceae bacterium]|nr:ABC transporter ATP-binding protein/permease [Oscillospiraceae bacterium]